MYSVRLELAKYFGGGCLSINILYYVIKYEIIII